MKVLGE
jgi:hypothetical protein